MNTDTKNQSTVDVIVAGNIETPGLEDEQIFEDVERSKEVKMCKTHVIGVHTLVLLHPTVILIMHIVWSPVVWCSICFWSLSSFVKVLLQSRWPAVFSCVTKVSHHFIN